MRYLAVAFDYDGTLAHDGRVAPSTIAALRSVRESGRVLILVTGRELEQLRSILPEIDIFKIVVAENGALLFDPASQEIKLLAEKPTDEFIDSLRKKNVHPISVGHAIVATWKPHEVAVLQTIRDLGLDLQVIFNKDAVMILPSGTNKATGLAAALTDLAISPHNVVAVGDAENDIALLSLCECGVAVSNAVPALKERADLVTSEDHGEGVEELIRMLLADDLANISVQGAREVITQANPTSILTSNE